MNASDIARQHHGRKASNGGWVMRCPCPGHGKGNGDRNPSCSISDGDKGLIVHCHAGCDPRDILRHLGVEKPEREPLRRPPVIRDDSNQHRNLAVQCWSEAVDSRGTIVEKYLAGRSLGLPAEVASEVIRFHPRCAWRDGGALIFVPAMVCAMRTIDGDDLVAVHRTLLTSDGQKVERRMLGPAGNAAIKLDADDTVTMGLRIGEGVETCLAARQLGLKPCWALGSAGAIARFPVLAGIDALTLLEEADDPSRRAVREAAMRWHAVGRQVIIVRPTIGKDLNDALRGAA